MAEGQATLLLCQPSLAGARAVLGGGSAGGKAFLGGPGGVPARGGRASSCPQATCPESGPKQQVQVPVQIPASPLGWLAPTPGQEREYVLASGRLQPAPNVCWIRCRQASLAVPVQVRLAPESCLAPRTLASLELLPASCQPPSCLQPASHFPVPQACFQPPSLPPRELLGILAEEPPVPPGRLSCS